ncbi:MAG: SUMF1/EgtB/PvdO family nonheme iron enzyme [Candidatus Cloacimonadales bacterium]
MIKRTIYLIVLVTFLLITACDNDDFVSPYDPSYRLLPPSDLKIKQIAVNKCKVSWKVNSLDEEGFKIARKKDSDEWVEDFAVLAKRSNEFIDDKVFPNSTYKYRVTVFADEYSSSSSESLAILDFLEPSNLQITQLSVSSCKLTWEDNSVGEDGFKISRKKNSEEWVESYAVLTANSEEFIDDKAHPNSTYTYRVTAFVDKYSSSSIESSILMEFSKPTNLQITQLSLSSCQLSWEDNSVGEEGYRISRKKDDEEWIESYAVLTANSDEFIDDKVLPNSTYKYRVTVFADEYSSSSSESLIIVDFPEPSNLQITLLSPSSCQLTWEDNSVGEEGYRISRKKNSEEWIESYAVLAANSEEFIEAEVDAWQNYSYRVSAFYEEVYSDFAEINIPGVSENFVYVPGGTFTMGRTTGSGASNALPTHKVTLSLFYIGKYEITQAEYQAVMGTNPSYFTGADKPVEGVSWYNAVEYCNARSTQEGLTQCYNTSDWSFNFSANGYRLPTEAEWEYAARGATNNPDYLYSGSNDINSVAWYESNSGSTTHNVGTKAPNSLGLYDMSGNVWEWCHDWYDNYSSGAQADPVGPTSGSYRVYRGGSWGSSATGCRVINRSYYNPSNSYNNLGFRVVRSLKYLF